MELIDTRRSHCYRTCYSKAVMKNMHCLTPGLVTRTVPQHVHYPTIFDSLQMSKFECKNLRLSVLDSVNGLGSFPEPLVRGVLRHQGNLRLCWPTCSVEGTVQHRCSRYSDWSHRGFASEVNTGAQVHSGNNLSNWFQTTSGVRQGCILAPAVFSVAIDWILNHISTTPSIKVGARQFTDLVCADDTTFFVLSASAECQASTARPQCSVCVFRGQKPNSRTSVLVYTVIHQTSRWMEIPWSKWTTSYTSAALSPPTAAVKLI